MGVLSCVVKSPPKCDRKEFFGKVKELGVEIKDIKSVYSVNNADWMRLLLLMSLP